jgi:hypothetical protein
MDTELKQCTVCNEVKPIAAYHRHAAYKTGRYSRCAECAREANKKWRNTKDYNGISNSRSTDVGRRFGLSSHQYKALLEKGKCDICKEPLVLGKSGFAIDHDHKTGKTRGILCARCNLVLGKIKDDIMLLRAAARYLVKWRNLPHE